MEAASLSSKPASASQTDIAILALPRIANFDDFDSLRAEPGVHIRHVDSVSQLGKPHAIIIPGTKSTIADLDWLRQTGLAESIMSLQKMAARLSAFAAVIKCLGELIRDPIAC